MLATPRNPSTRIVLKRLLMPLLVALLGIMVLAGEAHADASSPTEAPTSPLEEGIPPTQPEATETPPEAQLTETAGAGEQPESPASGETPPPASEEPAPPAAEEPISEPPPSEPVVVEEPAPAPPVEATPPTTTEATPPPTSSAPVESTSTEKAPAHLTVEEPRERASEAATQPSLVAGVSTGGGSGPTIVEAIPPQTSTATGNEIVDLGATTTSTDEGAAPPLSRGSAANARRAEVRRCELSALGDTSAGGCAGGWMSAQSEQPQLAATAGSVSSAIVIAGNSASGDGDGDNGAVGGSRPEAPSPGPAPGGAAGGGVAGGAAGGGVGLSGFLTLAGLLLLAAPRALRRLRLSCRPYLTAFFVLIPERPG